MKSKYDNFTNEELQAIIDDSNSIREVILRIGLSANGRGGYTIFHQKIKEKGLDIEGLKQRKDEYLKTLLASKREKIPLEQILVENSTYSITNLKSRLLEEGLLENVCDICGQLPEWNGKPLTLQLDHINGINDDNRLENLRIVCGHCHSQLPTTGSKKLKKKYYCECGNEKHKLSEKCNKCVTQPKKFEVTKEELANLLKEKSMVSIGKMFGVSDNAIRKRAKKLGII